MRDISLDYRTGKTIEGADAILQQYEICLFTNPDEFSPIPSFGIGIESYVGEVNNEITAATLRQHIISQTEAFFPEVAIKSINIFKISDNTLSVEIEVFIIPYAERKTLQKDITLTY